MIEFKIGYNCDCGYYISGRYSYLHKNFALHHRSTGYNGGDYGYGEAPGYYPTEAIAQAYLDEYLRRNPIKGEQKMMMKLSNGVEVSEDTIVSALKKAGINIEPKHVFEAGDVAESGSFNNAKRIIVSINSVMVSYDLDGRRHSASQAQFEANEYKYIGRLSDFIK